MAIDLEKLKVDAVLMSREQKTELLAKCGLGLRKALAEDQKKIKDMSNDSVELKNYCVPTELINEYDRVIDILKNS